MARTALVQGSMQHARAHSDAGVVASWPEWLWALTILGLSFHTFGAGRPQPADFALVFIICVPVVATKYKMPPLVARPVFWLIAFVAYIALCNTTWAAITIETEFFKSTLFYTFNFFVFLGYLVMLGHRGDAWLRWTLYGFAATLIMMTGLSIVFSDLTESGRLELFFTNPNQLGYHVLLSAGIVVMLAQRYNVSRTVVYLLLACAIYLEMRTYSRAGLLGTLLLGSMTLFQRQTLLTILALPLLLIALYMDLQSLDEALWEGRLSTVHEATADEYLTDRGLDRLFDHPQYLLLGAGEGYLLRFHQNKQEIHSSAANLVFSYGIIGALLFVAFLRRVVTGAGLRLTLLMVPALSFSLFHHGMRARPFWLILAIALGAGVMMSIDRAKARADSPIAVAKG